MYPWIENLIAAVAPEAATRRLVARTALREARAYEAAKNGRRTAGWRADSTSANAEITASLVTLRNRSRSLVRDNPYAGSAISKLVANSIGTGIVPKFADPKAQGLWASWQTECDAEGDLDFYGLQSLAARTLFESGEVLVRFRPRRLNDGLTVPLQIQILEGDFLDQDKTEDLPGGGYIIQGVEFNAIGQVQAYWLFDRHPGEVGRLFRSLTSRRIPASELLLVFERHRPGQVRGVPRLASVMLKLRDIDDVEDATLMRKKVEACLAAFVTSADPNKTLGVAQVSPDGQPATRLAPAQINRLRPGETVEFSNPPSSQGYADYMRTQLRAVAAGSGVTYEQLTGDLSQVNYSSSRAGMLEFRRDIERWQWLTFIPLFCQPIAARFLQAAWLADSLKSPDSAVSWTPPKFDWVDPVKDVAGELLEIAAGLKPWQEAVRRRGYDPDEVLAQVKADQQKFADNGVVIQIDKLALGAAAGLAKTTDNPNPAPSGA